MDVHEREPGDLAELTRLIESDPSTTQLYDRRRQSVMRNIVERIATRLTCEDRSRRGRSLHLPTRLTR